MQDISEIMLSHARDKTNASPGFPDCDVPAEGIFFPCSFID
jgi:hypothetical protein